MSCGTALRRRKAAQRVTADRSHSWAERNEQIDDAVVAERIKHQADPSSSSHSHRHRDRPVDQSKQNKAQHEFHARDASQCM